MGLPKLNKLEKFSAKVNYTGPSIHFKNEAIVPMGLITLAVMAARHDGSTETEITDAVKRILKRLRVAKTLNTTQ